ncbi:hypothetical protein RND81_14G047900 [Saponaria officinalis]|uniref:S-protein homolog n=1 Tax=Saponaria officinalis TaxID=3572 RepID=A0AAW1GHQ6_SAPOF
MSNDGVMLIMLTIATMFVMAKLSLGYEYFYITSAVVGKHSPVKFRCQSGDEDTGELVLHEGSTYEHRFDGMWSNTLYFCHFYLDNKDKVFDVWVYKPDKEGCWIWKTNPWYLPDERIHNGQVEWVIKDDGFYKHCVYKKRELDNEGRMKKLPLDTMIVKKYDW